MSFRDVQYLLDENTDNISEGLYIELSRLLMEAHNARSSEITEAINSFSDSITRHVIAQSGDDILNEIVGLRCENNFLRDQLRETMEMSINLRSRIDMYKSQITSSCRKNEEYKKKIKELEVIIDLKKQEIDKITRKDIVAPKPNMWISHVHQWAKDHKIKYSDALKSGDCRQAYRTR